MQTLQPDPWLTKSAQAEAGVLEVRSPRGLIPSPRLGCPAAMSRPWPQKVPTFREGTASEMTSSRSWSRSLEPLNHVPFTLR